jgi:hypothetical protein
MYIASLALSIIASIAVIVANCRLHRVGNKIDVIEKKLIDANIQSVNSQVYIAGGDLKVISFTEAQTNEIHSPPTEPTDTT